MPLQMTGFSQILSVGLEGKPKTSKSKKGRIRGKKKKGLKTKKTENKKAELEEGR